MAGNIVSDIPVYVLAGQSNAEFSGVDNKLVEIAMAAGGAFEFVKLAVGGTSIFANAASDWDPATDGELLDQLIAAINAATANVTAQGHTPVVHMLWIQGEADLGRSVSDYAAKLTALFAEVRSATGQPEATFDIALLPFDSRVRTAQLQIDAADDRVRTIETWGAKFWDGVHYDKPTREAIATRFMENMGVLTPDGSGATIAAQPAATDYASLLRTNATTSVNGVITYVRAPDYLDFAFTGDNRHYSITSFSGDDRIVTGAGNDSINTGGNDDTIDSGAGNDFIDAGAHDDTVRAGAGNDAVLGRSGSDTIYGGDGDDYIDPGEQDDFADGGAGTDTLSYSTMGAGVTVDLRITGPQATGGAGADTVLNLENLTGTNFADTLTGNALANVIAGGGGADLIYGGDGNDTLQGGAQNDVLYGEAGDDVLDGGANDDYIDGGAGFDTASYASATAGVTLVVGRTTAQDTIGAGIDTLVGIEGFAGSAYADTFVMASGSNETVNGGVGVDTVTYYGAGFAINATLGGSATGVDIGTDTLIAIENIVGTNFADVITGDAQDNLIDGRDGADVLSGGAGNDTILGGGRNDLIDGGDGNDYLDGGTGGGWVDTVTYASARAGVTLVVGQTTAQDTVGAGIDTLVGFENFTGSAYNDSFTMLSGLDNVIDGGAGVDTVSYYANGFALTATLGGSATGIGMGIDTLLNVENIVGTNFADVIRGDDGDNMIDGRDGADVLFGGGGNDTILGGSRNDLIDGGEGNDLLDGGAGGGWVDTVTYASAKAGVTLVVGQTTAQDTIGAGIDTLLGFENFIGSAFADTFVMASGIDNVVDGGAGIDTVSYFGSGFAITARLGGTVTGTGIGTDTLVAIENITGTNFADTLTGDAQDNVIDGRDGNDVLFGGAGNDTILGGGRNDLVDGGEGDDVLDGGTGGAWIDTVTYASALAGVRVSLALAGPQDTIGAGIDTLAGFENLTGSAFADTLTGDGAANEISGGAGDDRLFGGSGNDVLLGGANDDLLDGGAGNDTLDGGTGIDTATYAAATAAVTVTLGQTTAQDTIGAGVDTLIGIENLVGSAFNDSFNLVSGADNVVDGGAGIDTVSYAANGFALTATLGGTATGYGMGTDTLIAIENITGTNFNDTIAGDALDNVIDGKDGHDVLFGGAGNDTILGGGRNDLIDGGDGNDTLDGGTGGAWIDTVTFASAKAGVTVSLALTGAQDTIGAGIDTLAGFENLTGSAFADTLTGDAARNVLDGGAGDDRLAGGGGADRFVFDANSGRDTITDFSSAQGDQVDLVAAVGGHGSFVGTAGFSGSAGQVGYALAGDGIDLSVDSDGDGLANLIVHLSGVTSLSQNDLLLG